MGVEVEVIEPGDGNWMNIYIRNPVIVFLSCLIPQFIAYKYKVLMAYVAVIPFDIKSFLF
jgi:hypothetical protein